MAAPMLDSIELSSLGVSTTVVGSSSIPSNDCIVAVGTTDDTEDHVGVASLSENHTTVISEGGSHPFPAAHHVLDNYR